MLQDRQQSLEPSGTARLGAEMRAARQRLGWGVSELAASLRIRPQYLEAIEDGRVADLPGTTYALGFIRAYGNALGLPGAEYATRFRAEGGPANKRTELAFPVPVPQRGVPAGAVVLLGMLVVAAAYGGWYYYSADQRTPSHVVAALPERLAPLAANGGLAAPPSPQVASILPSVAPPSQLPPAVAAGDAAATGATSRATPPAAAPTIALPPAAVPPKPAPPAAPGLAAASTGDASATASSPVGEAAPAPAPPAVAAPSPTTGIVVKAVAQSWVMVRDAGKVLLNRTMQPGETWPLPADATGATLTTGNAGGTVVMVDGADTPSLGASGAVRRGVVLEAAGLRSGHPVSAPAGATPPARTASDRLNDAELRRSHLRPTDTPE